MSASRAVARHRPVSDNHRRFDGLPVVHCRDCGWAQALDPDLHEGPYSLIYWHTDHPGQSVDHLGVVPARLTIPAYVQWWQYGPYLALTDERCERSVLFDRVSLTIFRSISTDGDLGRAVTATAQRLDISPVQARDNVVHTATGLYRKGLLRPTPWPKGSIARVS